MISHPRIAVSSWSLHRKLGLTYPNGPADHGPVTAQPTFGTAELTFLEWPAAMATHGYFKAEICHFHLAALDPVYIEEVRLAFRDAGVAIQTLLIDAGDITDVNTRARDMAWMNEMIGVAARLGAVHARAIAGKRSPDTGTLALAVSGLRHLCKSAATQGVKLVTENWFDLTSTPEAVHHVLDTVGSDLGLLADMGNWSGPGKYADLASIFGRAALCHAKASFAPGLKLDETDYQKCLTAAETAGYKGPYTLIFADDGDEWEGLDAERNFIVDFLAENRSDSA